MSRSGNRGHFAVASGRIAVATLSLALLLAPPVPAQNATAPEDAAYDVLFIAVDDLNDWVGFLGGHPQT